MIDSLQSLLEIIHSGSGESWNQRNKQAFEALFGAPVGRYRRDAKDTVALRAPEFSSDIGVPFAAYIHPSNPTAGPYGGMSFVIFPVSDAPCLVATVVGTQGLSPDEAILGRPGHARKIQAICAWVNKQYGKRQQIAWAKQDPTRVDLDVPGAIKRTWSPYQRVFERYGKVIYGAFTPTADREGTAAAVTALLDVMFEERGQKPLAQFTEQSEAVQAAWFEHLMASTTREQVTKLLDRRRYVILQGPPGTGKTLMAGQILRDEYASLGRSIQFHPNTTVSLGATLPPRMQARKLGELRAAFASDASSWSLPGDVRFVLPAHHSSRYSSEIRLPYDLPRFRNQGIQRVSFVIGVWWGIYRSTAVEAHSLGRVSQGGGVHRMALQALAFNRHPRNLSHKHFWGHVASSLDIPCFRGFSCC